MRAETGQNIKKQEQAEREKNTKQEWIKEMMKKNKMRLKTIFYDHGKNRL